MHEALLVERLHLGLGEGREGGVSTRRGGKGEGEEEGREARERGREEGRV